jgi:ribosomal protein S18 acetylase RimI-like enzyme
MHALDNVIWQALTTQQEHLAEASGSARRFCPEISPLAAFSAPNARGYHSLAQLLHPGDVAGIFLAEPYSSMPGWRVVRRASLRQMVRENAVSSDTDYSPGQDFVRLSTADLPEMLALAKLTQPGPFNARTHELGTYLGIRSEGSLVAMAGERLRLPGYTEISAVCTHPSHIGRGYARFLMTQLMNRIEACGETAFLHVRQDNGSAIEIYERLGFRERALLHYAVIQKDGFAASN